MSEFCDFVQWTHFGATRQLEAATTCTRADDLPVCMREGVCVRVSTTVTIRGTLSVFVDGFGDRVTSSMFIFTLIGLSFIGN